MFHRGLVGKSGSSSFPWKTVFKLLGGKKVHLGRTAWIQVLSFLLITRVTQRFHIRPVSRNLAYDNIFSLRNLPLDTYKAANANDLPIIKTTQLTIQLLRIYNAGQQSAD